MGTVLVLRERRAAERTAAELRELGHRPIVLPVQSFKALQPDAPLPEDPGAVLLSSPEAVPFASGRFPAGTPVLTVGPATAQAAREAGFQNVEAAEGSGAALARLAAERQGNGAPFLYLAGRVRNPELEDALDTAGVPHRTVEVYDTLTLYPTGEEIEAALGDQPPEAALILSIGQAEGLMRLIETRSDLFMPNLRLLCLSQRIARGVPDEIDGTVFVAARPELEALYELL